MKEILFVLPHMLCGGVEKALLALVNELPKDEYNISIFMVKSEGDFVSLIPDNIKIGELPLDENIRNELMLGGIIKSLRFYAKNKHPIKFMKVIYNILQEEPLATLTCDFNEIPEMDNQYDIAICFHVHMPFIVKYVADKVKSKNKIAWIHNDFKMSGFDVKKLEKSLKKYNHFFTVSQQLMDEFVSIFPDFLACTSVAHNIVSEQYIRSNLNGKAVTEYNKQKFNILSIGRLDKQKGFDIAIKACKELYDKGYNFKWYVLGTGIEESNLRKQIQDSNLTDIFILLGIRINPYPYIEQCDLYVQPSRHEGYGIAVAEARMLDKPIICTDFTGARDQIINGKTGSIVSFDEHEIALEIEKIILNNDIREYYSNNLHSSVKENAEKLDNIIKYFS